MTSPLMLSLAGPLLGGVALAATRTATGRVLGWLRHKQILDLPNERSSHTIPTPRGGGLAVTPVLLLGWGLLALFGQMPSGSAVVLPAAAGLLALSWWDDRHSLSARLRLGMHMLAVLAGLASFPSDSLLFQGLLPLGLDRFIAFLLWVWFLNLYNFMDGIDGITGGQTASLAAGLILLGGSGALPAWLLLGVALGFLRWNWHRAAIFLGDSGSVPLGYLLGWLLLRLAGEGYWAAALILPAYYLADATITLTKRALRGEKIWQAHRQHFYQQAVRGGWRHDQVVIRILAANAGLVACALWSVTQPVAALGVAAVIVAGLLGLLARAGQQASQP